MIPLIDRLPYLHMYQDRKSIETAPSYWLIEHFYRLPIYMQDALFFNCHMFEYLARDIKSKIESRYRRTTRLHKIL